MSYKTTFLKVVGVLFLIVFLVQAIPSFSNIISEITLNQNNNLRPRCVIRTSDKTVHVVYWNKEGSIFKLYYINSKDDGRNWSPPFLLSQNYNDSKNACLAADESGKLYVLWADSGKILYTYTIDNGKKWSPIYKISGRYDHADNPSAIISNVGDIHLAFESDGEIYYRTYQAREKAWSTIYNISQTGALSKQAQISISSGDFIGVVWVEDGEIAFREMIIPSNIWNDKEIVSREAESLYTLKQKGNLNPQIVIDSKKRVHTIWGNGNKIVHRMRVKEFWSPAPTLLAKDAMQWFGAPACTLDTENSVYCAWIEKGKIAFRKFTELRAAWEATQKLSGTLQSGYDTAPAMGPAWSKENYKPREGFDLAFIKHSTLESKDYKLQFFSNASFATSLGAPVITSVVQTGGRLSITWQIVKEQNAFRVIVGNTSPVVTPYLYDSGIVSDKSPTHLTKSFAFSGPSLYVQVKTADRQGNWSSWSKPYGYQLTKLTSAAGPEIKLKGIEENSLYLYSPSANILYFGNGLDSPKSFTIYGSALGKNSGIKQISFSKFANNTPPPIIDPESSDWEVQYSVHSADDPGEITITATDYNGNSSQTKIQVIKDATPPKPPTWVRINPDREGHESFKEKKYNKNKVYVFWKSGSDNESGIRYHVMGTSNQWWKDSVHHSGDSEIAHEGLNTFYVFAVDNVGNVSAPGTDTIFIDTVPPYPPKFVSNMTSSNAIYGTKSPDAIEILVDGLNRNVEIISSTDWKYNCNLKENEIRSFSLQAIDELENKSEIISMNIQLKTVPPQLLSFSHEPNKIFRGKDIIVIKLKGEPGNLASADIPQVAYNITLKDDGKKGDEKKNDGEYTASYTIDPHTPSLETQIVGILTDRAGNRSEMNDPVPLKINSHQSVLLDDFEVLGKVYPWTNHVTVKNIDSSSEKDLKAMGGGIGICKVEYNLSGHQNWAAFSSREFIAKNCYGLSPRISFKLKGSGSRTCKAAIKLRTKKNKAWSKEIKEFPSSEYTFSLGNRSWQTIEVPLPGAVLNDLDQIIQYSVIIYSPNNRDKGVFYLDNLEIIYKDTPRGRIIQKTLPRAVSKPLPIDRKEVSFKPEAQPQEMVYPEVSPGEFVPAPYLSVILYPNPIRAGSPVRLKVNLPAKYRANEVAVLLWRNGNKLISSKLKNTNQTWWHGVTSMPTYVKEGSYFGTLYVKTKAGHFLKTRFPFQVISQGSRSSIDQVSTTFYPHPFIPGVGTTIKVRIPRNLQAKKVALFFGESNGKPILAELLIKNITSSVEYWHGSVSLPSDLAVGDYNAILYIKTRDNQYFKKKLKYSVLQK